MRGSRVFTKLSTRLNNFLTRQRLIRKYGREGKQLVRGIFPKRSISIYIIEKFYRFGPSEMRTQVVIDSREWNRLSYEQQREAEKKLKDIMLQLEPGSCCSNLPNKPNKLFR